MPHNGLFPKYFAENLAHTLDCRLHWKFCFRRDFDHSISIMSRIEAEIGKNSAKGGTKNGCPPDLMGSRQNRLILECYALANDQCRPVLHLETVDQ
jgi:hypothetical protein